LHQAAAGHDSAGGQRTLGQGQASEALRGARAGNVEQGMAAGTSHLHERQLAADVSTANRAASRDHRDSRGLPRPLSYSEQLEKDASSSLARWKASGKLPDTESPKDKAEREAWLKSPEAKAERARTAAEDERGEGDEAGASLEKWKKSGQMPDTESRREKHEREAWLKSPEAKKERERTKAEDERGERE